MKPETSQTSSPIKGEKSKHEVKMSEMKPMNEADQVKSGEKDVKYENEPEPVNENDVKQETEQTEPSEEVQASREEASQIPNNSNVAEWRQEIRDCENFVKVYELSRKMQHVNLNNERNDSCGTCSYTYSRDDYDDEDDYDEELDDDVFEAKAQDDQQSAISTMAKLASNVSVRDVSTNKAGDGGSNVVSTRNVFSTRNPRKAGRPSQATNQKPVGTPPRTSGHSRTNSRSTTTQSIKRFFPTDKDSSNLDAKKFKGPQ